MNPILLIGLFVIAFFLGVSTEEVAGKSKVAQVILLVLWVGELVFLVYSLFWFPMTVLSVVTYFIEILFMAFMCYLGTLITMLKHRIAELEEKKCPS